jgi:hypothetical protein
VVKNTVLQNHSEEVADVPDWIKTMKKVMLNFTDVKNSEFAKRLGQMISALVALNFVEAPEDNVYKLNGYHLFEVQVWDVQKDAIDFFEVMANSVVFFS